MTDTLWSAQWRLARVEVVNWGTFAGHHGVNVDRKGHLVTGPSGSGKSSLLDAIAVVLTPGKWVTFNAAAQDASVGRGDRSTVSYVRGAWSKEADEVEDRTVAAYLRPRATWTGVMLRYEDGQSDPVTLVRLFHLRGTSTDTAGLKDTCVVVRGTPSLADFADFASDGIKVRDLKASLRPVIATESGKHGPFYARVRALLGISDPNALKLLHKTQSAKNLGTLDKLFRDFMLEEPATFKRSATAVEQFGELSDAYEHVLDLRLQAVLLEKAADAAEAFDAALTRELAAEGLASLVEPYAAGIKHELATKSLRDAQVAHASAEQAAREVRRDADAAREEWEAARAVTLSAGGADASHLRARIEEALERVENVERERARLQTRLRSAGIDMPGSAVEYAELTVEARRVLADQGTTATDYELHDTHAQTRRDAEALEREISELRRRRSNIDGKLLRVRTELASRLGVPEEALPFGGELIEVPDEQRDWRGAIERVLAPLATALLVRDDMLEAVRRHVDGWHVGARLVIEAVPADSAPPPRSRDPRSLVHRVTVADGAFMDYLNRRIGADFDVACVVTPNELGAVERGITRAGLFKRSARRYEKDDRRAVDDPGSWVLGGNNEAKVELLLERLVQARGALDRAKAEVDKATAERDIVARRRDVLDEVAHSPFARIDVDHVRATLGRRQRELAALVNPDSDLDRAMGAEQRAEGAYRDLDAQASRAQGDASAAGSECGRLARLLGSVDTAGFDQIAADDRSALDARFTAVQRSRTLDSIDGVSQKVTTRLAAEGRAAQTQVREAESLFVRHAATYCEQWRLQSADLSPVVGDRDAFGERFAAIKARGLPEHEDNFRKLLRDRSRDTIIHLRDEIMSAPKVIERRVDPVNESLRRAEYDPGVHLQIRPKLSRSNEVSDFLRDLARVVEGSFAEESLTDAEKRFAVLSGVMRRLGSSEAVDQSWRKRVLDTREHVTFQAREIDGDGRVVNVHDSSAGLSGGQRQKLVVFCLAAALRYQLAQEDDDVPRYGTIILDEAFDKADAEYTRLAMNIFVEFGFHMVLATPQKLLQTLEPYIGAVTVVSNPTRKASHLARVSFRSESTPDASGGRVNLVVAEEAGVDVTG